MRALGIDPVHDTRRTFDGLLEAMSRPGTVHAVPAPADHAVVATLVDHEVTLATDDETVRDALADQGRFKRAPFGEADIVHAREHIDWDVQDCRRGSLTEPSDGATVVYRVETLDDDAANGTTLSLSGPGVDGTATLSVALPETELSALAAAQSDYPRGVDAIFATEDRVAALPRSVTMEVV
ncbi:phosphonate C-P lyase system protein PhnH [Natrinema saccharevitans]|uniref:Phosphonate C-P lyase system protein PhnH n=1 Tax=Natrinema saccharevitans TaxID=301967 RepID=A0A1S8AR99_9EURY|nr:phosphonate C-P lyase system protein PhnH [Natrinema saccharevitans]OLZ39190.1 phosphonate C-P lyase system protein PhnH [Natrinema saccharevitans]